MNDECHVNALTVCMDTCKPPHTTQVSCEDKEYECETSYSYSCYLGWEHVYFFNSSSNVLLERSKFSVEGYLCCTTMQQEITKRRISV